MIRITIVIISALLRVNVLIVHLTTSGLRPWCNTKLLQHSYLGSCILFLVIVLFFCYRYCHSGSRVLFSSFWLPY